MLTRRSLLITGAAFSVGSPYRAGAQTRSAPLRVGTVATASLGTAFYAKELGYFSDGGLNVKIELFNSTDAVVAAMAGGSLDVGLASIATVAVAHARGIPMTFVAPAGLYVATRPTSALFVAPSSPYHRARDFHRKIFAVTTLHDLGQIATLAWLTAGGAASQGNRFVELPFASMARAIVSGRIDAAIIAEPFLTLAKEKTRLIAYPYTTIADRFMLSGAVASRHWIAQHASEARTFREAMSRAAAWGNDHPADAAAILAKYGKSPLSLLTEMTPPSYAMSLTPSLLQPVIDAAARFGSIRRTFPAEEIIAPA